MRKTNVRRLPLLVLPMLLALSLLVLLIRPPASPTTPRSGTLSVARGASASQRDLMLEVVHVVWDNPGNTLGMKRMQDAQRLRWIGPGKAAFEESGQSLWPGMGFRVIKLEKYPVSVNGHAQFRCESRFRFKNAPNLIGTEERSTIGDLKFLVDRGHLVLRSHFVPIFVEDDGRVGPGLCPVVTKPLEVDEPHVETVSDVGQRGDAFATFSVCYHASEEKTSS